MKNFLGSVLVLACLAAGCGTADPVAAPAQVAKSQPAPAVPEASVGEAELAPDLAAPETRTQVQHLDCRIVQPKCQAISSQAGDIDLAVREEHDDLTVVITASVAYVAGGRSLFRMGLKDRVSGKEETRESLLADNQSLAAAIRGFVGSDGRSYELACNGARLARGVTFRWNGPCGARP